ncbi:MAG: hypothetical protein HUJ98_00535 [Bacteroidaceae bacterium]|nr:hypothetical protein [Bacteroidaceae bacterium]
MNIYKFFLILALGCTAVNANSQQTCNVIADFGNWAEYPLVKKFGVYQTPLTCERWLERDLPKLSNLQARTMRYEIAWGKRVFGYPMIQGTKDNLQFDFTGLDYFCDNSLDYCESLVLSHGYCPDVVKPFTDNYSTDWRQAPTDYEAWAEINRSFTDHYLNKGYSNHYIEVWNEPDLNIFFLGTLDDYKNIYRYAAPSVRQADPDVKVGGPAGAGSGWHRSLVDMVKEENLPLDFISGHAYGQCEWQLDAMRSALIAYGNDQAEMLLTEYAPYPTNMQSIHRDGLVEQAEAAMTFFNALPVMLEYTDLTHVTWAQYIDAGDPYSEKTFPAGMGDKMGLIDGDYGYRKALYNAFLLYGRMPINRRAITVGNGLKGLASADDKCVAVAVWNPDELECKMLLSLTNIPFSSGRMEVFQIDKGHNSWYETGLDELVASADRVVTIEKGRLNLTSSIKGKGLYFVIITADNAEPALVKNNFAKVIRTHQCYDGRSASAPYALFDSKTWNAYLSLAGSSDGQAIVGVTAENLPDKMRVETLMSDGFVNRGNSSTVNLRIDYRSSNGEYIKSVLFHGDIHNSGTTKVPKWGTMRVPDYEAKVDDFSDFIVNIKDYAPSDWDGRAIITFEQTATGSSTKTNFSLSRIDATYLSDVKVSEVTSGSASLSADILGKIDNVNSVGFVLKADGDPMNGGTEHDAVLNDGTFTCTVNGLDKDINYHVRGFYVDNFGNRVYTSQTTFHTYGDCAKLSFTKPNLTGDVLTLSAMVLDDGGTQVYERGFVWSENGEDPQYGLNSCKVGSGMGAFSTRLGGFDPEIVYTFRAYAKNSGGIAFSAASYTLSNGEVSGISAETCDDDFNLGYDAKLQSIVAESALKVEVYDTLGRLKSTSCAMSPLSVGVYFCRALFPGNIVKTIRFLKEF